MSALPPTTDIGRRKSAFGCRFMRTRPKRRQSPSCWSACRKPRGPAPCCLGDQRTESQVAFPCHAPGIATQSWSAGRTKRVVSKQRGPFGFPHSSLAYRTRIAPYAISGKATKSISGGSVGPHFDLDAVGEAGDNVPEDAHRPRRCSCLLDEHLRWSLSTFGYVRKGPQSGHSISPLQCFLSANNDIAEWHLESTARGSAALRRTAKPTRLAKCLKILFSGSLFFRACSWGPMRSGVSRQMWPNTPRSVRRMGSQARRWRAGC